MAQKRDANMGARGVPAAQVYGGRQREAPSAVVSGGGHEYVDPFADDTPIACDADSPEFCEACD